MTTGRIHSRRVRSSSRHRVDPPRAVAIEEIPKMEGPITRANGVYPHSVRVQIGFDFVVARGQTRVRIRREESMGIVTTTHIVSTTGVCGGRPRIDGHRITVENVAVWHEQMGMTVEEIASEYNLSLAEVHAALAYYFDHRPEIADRLKEAQALGKEMRERSPSRLKEKLGR